MISRRDLEWLGLELNCYAHRITPEMSAFELREALTGIPGSKDLTIARAPNGNQIIHIGDKSLEVGPAASNDEIIAALQNPFIRTENTKLSINPIDRLKEKLAKAAGVGGRVAAKIEAKADALIGREDELINKAEHAFAGHEAIADAANTELDTIEAALSQLSNGGPPLNG